MTRPRHRSASAALALVLVLIAAAVARPAAADGAPAAPADTALARSHFLRAEAEFAAGRHAEAVVEYRAAYAIVPEPALLFNIAQCHRALGQYQPAIEVLRQYLRARAGEPAQASGRSGAVCVATACVEALIDELQRRQDAVAALTAPRPAEPAPPAVRPSALDRTETDADRDAARIQATVAPTAPARRTPIYRRWWFITGTAAVIAAGVVTAIVVTRDPCGGYDACYGR